MTVGRYVRAFFKALKLTLTGRQISQPFRHPALQDWVRQTTTLVSEIVSRAEAEGYNAAQRAEIQVIIDKRTVTLESALQVIKHHAEREYPYLLKRFDQYSLMTLQATNLNDRYMVLRFTSESTLPSTIQAKLAELRDHLDAIPSLEDTNKSS